ncbi:hypothetical protein LJB42_001657 [Komagataella kurtzmanii]|nr:hypothetical protein LJB42_001657 [Komagataella kurtzmanii]
MSTPQQNRPVASGTPASSKGPRRRKPRNGKGHSKLQQINRLIKQFPPLTINGIAVTGLKETVPEYIKRLSEKEEWIYLSFLLRPEADFPFELEFLSISLGIPPKLSTRPEIAVLNDDIPRGYSLNIESGFKAVANKAVNSKTRGSNPKGKGKSTGGVLPDNDDDDLELVGMDLLGMILTLRKYLEKFLSQKKKETIKIVKSTSVKGDSSGQKSEKSLPKPKKEKEQKESNIPKHIQNLRERELARLEARLKPFNIRKFKENNYSTVYIMTLQFNPIVINIEDMEKSIHSLPIRLSIPKDYLSNAKKPVKLDVIMTDPIITNLTSSSDKGYMLVLSKLLSNIMNNFTTMAIEDLKRNVDSLEQTDSTVQPETLDTISLPHTVTSQMNYFIVHIEKFLLERRDFSKWYELMRSLI